MAYWLGNNLFGQTGWIKRFKQARKKPKERKFEEEKNASQTRTKGDGNSRSTYERENGKPTTV